MNKKKVEGVKRNYGQKDKKTNLQKLSTEAFVSITNSKLSKQRHQLVQNMSLNLLKGFKYEIAYIKREVKLL